MKKLKFVFLFLLIAVLSLISFSLYQNHLISKTYSTYKKEEFSYRFSLIKTGVLTLVQESCELSSPKKTPYSFFYSGWRRIKGASAVLVNKRGLIKFYILDPGKTRIFSFKAFRKELLSRHRIVKLSLFVNGHFLGYLKLHKDGSLLKAEIPGPYLKKGENWAEIRLETRVKFPQTSLKDKSSPEALKLEDVKILPSGGICSREKFEIKEDFSLIQPNRSYLEFYLIPTPHQRLRFFLFNKKTITGFIKSSKARLIMEIAADGERTSWEKVFDLSHDTVLSREIKLSAYKDRKIRIRFTFLSKKRDDQIIWKDLSLKYKPAFTRTLSSAAPRVKPQKKAPHIFLILADAARYDFFKFSGNEENLTPNVDKLATESLIFKNFYSNAPYTIASVSTMLTSLLPEAHGARHMDSRLPEKVRTLPYYLKKKGYHSAVLTATVFLTEKYNLAKDFDEIISIRNEERSRENSYVDLEKIKSYLKQLDFSTPQFIYIHLLPPHEPYRPPYRKFYRYERCRWTHRWQILHTVRIGNLYNNFEPSFINFRKQCYKNNLLYADYLVGEILKVLKKLRVYRKSLIFFTADHGEAFGEHGFLGHNWTLFEEMIRIPFLMKLPGQTEMKSIEARASLVDFMPTVLELVGLQVSTPVQGRSLLSLIEKNSPETTRLIYARAAGPKLNLAIIYKNWKYIFFEGKEYLFNLLEDPTEKRNLAFEFPVLKGYLRQLAFYQLQINRKLNLFKGEKVKMTEKLKETLRSLGYL